MTAMDNTDTQSLKRCRDDLREANTAMQEAIDSADETHLDIDALLNGNETICPTAKKEHAFSERLPQT